MSAPTSGSADGSPAPGYYPDPSIPGYIRYWNGGSWVPGTSRPAPGDGEAMPGPPPGAAAPVSAVPAQPAVPAPDETGPMFFDEHPDAALAQSDGDDFPQTRGATAPGAQPAVADWDDPRRLHGNRPEPAASWQADASHQSGLPADHDRHVSWGSTPTAPGPASGAPGTAPAGSGPASGASAGSPAPYGPAAGAAWAAPADGSAGAGRPDTGRDTGRDTSRTAARPGAPESGRPVPSADAPGEPGTPGAGASPAAGAPAASGGGPTLGLGTSRDGSGPSGPGRRGDGTLTIRAVPSDDDGGDDPAAAEGASGRRDSTVTIRAARPGEEPDDAPGRKPPARKDGTPTIRRVDEPGRLPGQDSVGASGTAGPMPGQAPGHGAQPAAPGASRTPAGGQGGAAAQPLPGGAPASGGAGVQSGSGSPAASGAPAGGGAGSWAQQVHQLAQGDPGAGGAGGGVAPWRPPVNGPFLAAAQAQASMRPAGLGRRLLARVIDSVVFCALLAAAAVPLGIKAMDHIDAKIEQAKLTGETVTVWLLDGTTGMYLGIVLGVFLVLGVLYEVLPNAKWGRTLGKRLCGARVVNIESHESPSFGEALRRWLVHGVLGLLVVGVFNVLWCVFDRPWRQCWHDKAARTFVAGDSTG